MTMKLKFDPNLKYQDDAIESVVGLFKGQSRRQSHFTLSQNRNMPGILYTEQGIGNKLELSREDIEKNLQQIQLKNGLPQSESLSELDFDIEMETGTGKTYVYLKSILRLNEEYGFTKFIIVVPSLAIKEGVYKTLQITESHFKESFNNIIYDYFVYDSSKLDQVRNFAQADHISIMVINIDAFRRSFSDPTKLNKQNIIHRANDRLNGDRPIDLIAQTNPFVIIDEPQSVDTTAKSKEAIDSLNPQVIFRYSATHRDKHHLIYKLDAIDAFKLGLVKQIEVTSFASESYHNRAYLNLKSVSNKNSQLRAKIEMDVQNKKGVVQRKMLTVRAGDDLFELSGGRDVYRDYLIEEIYCGEGNEYVSFTSQETILRLNSPIGDVDDLAIKEQQMKATIEEHLQKELMLHDKGVKVLSLFFIDRVANYRSYDEEGNPQKGVYAEMFERLYAREINKPKYLSLFNEVDTDSLPQQVHDGYFSTDNKGKAKDTSGNTVADEDAYSLIMKDKERLLSFDTNLKFIFSHSALREGWDNPNVFQICTLNETKSQIKKRQEIGRGLRLCVNQEGERLHGNNINRLTVMANESYDEFCAQLQKEYEEDNKIKFGYIEKHIFANIPIETPQGEIKPLGQQVSTAVFKSFIDSEYIDKKGKIQEKFKVAVRDNTVILPDVVLPYKEAIVERCQKAVAGLPIKETKERRQVKLNKQRFLDPAFKELWERIKYQTTYRVEFNVEELVNKAREAIQKEVTNQSVGRAKLVKTEVDVMVKEPGVQYEVKGVQTVDATLDKAPLPNIIDYLQNKTNLTRRTLVRILSGSNTLDLFIQNPQEYMEKVYEVISREMKLLIVDGIKYQKIGTEAYYAQELFEKEELFGYLNQNMIESEKSIYEYVVFDSKNEESFANSFEKNSMVKVYAKLPAWFKIPTPLGNYNPDWAVVVEQEGKERLYLVVETKGDTSKSSLRSSESAKIDCGYAHFEALGQEVEFSVQDNPRDFFVKMYD